MQSSRPAVVAPAAAGAASGARASPATPGVRCRLLLAADVAPRRGASTLAPGLRL